MKEIQKFTKFFHEIGELCFQIHKVERPLNVIDFTTQENQIINPDYFKSVKEKYPDVIKGFSIAMQKHGECLNFYLTKDFNVIVEYSNTKDVIKTTYNTTIDKIKEDMPVYINYLTKHWKL